METPGDKRTAGQRPPSPCSGGASGAGRPLLEVSAGGRSREKGGGRWGCWGGNGEGELLGGREVSVGEDEERSGNCLQDNVSDPSQLNRALESEDDAFYVLRIARNARGKKERKAAFVMCRGGWDGRQAQGITFRTCARLARHLMSQDAFKEAQPQTNSRAIVQLETGGAKTPNQVSLPTFPDCLPSFGSSGNK